MYTPKLTVIETEKCIKDIREYFERTLSSALNLMRVSAPLFVTPESGLNDDLNGVESPVSFDFKSKEVGQIVQSLAKWKRMALYKYGFSLGSGLYTNMNAVRRDEDLSPIHSYYVDQWDWELIISKQERSLDKLKATVLKIYEAIKETEAFIVGKYPKLERKLVEDIFFITSQELEDLYPESTPKEREYKICREKGAVFVMQIGKKLKSGIKHDGRAPDYDDWDLNGDILVYYKPLDIALELSSMGIRVDEKSLIHQLKVSNNEDRIKYDFHKMIADQKLPYTIGGGIGQSRLCLCLMDKIHIGEVQSSIWSKEIESSCKEAGIPLL